MAQSTGHFAAGDSFLPLRWDIMHIVENTRWSKFIGILFAAPQLLLLVSIIGVVIFFLSFFSFFLILFLFFFFVPFITLAEDAGCILHFQVSLVLLSVALIDQAAGCPAPTDSYQYPTLLSHNFFKQLFFKSDCWVLSLFL